MTRWAPPLLSLVLASAAACGGDDGGGGGGGGPDGGAQADAGAGGPDAGCAGDCEEPRELVVFFFDQQLDRIIRLEDANLDGDLMDPGEATVFFDNAAPPLGVFNSQGMVALGPSELLASDNVTPDNEDAGVMRLVDLNGDGDALDEGEATLWYAGEIPGGGAVTFPTDLARGPDGAVYLVNNDFSDELPDLILRLEDADQDGQVSGDGEVSVHFDLATVTPTPQLFDLVFDGGGQAYTVDIRQAEGEENNASIDRIPADGSGMIEMVDAVDLYTFTASDERLIMPGLSEQLAFDPASGRVLLATIDAYGPQHKHILAFSDDDQDGTFKDPGEMTILWDQQTADVSGFGGIRDLVVLAGGDLLLVDAGSDRIFRLSDTSGDGDLGDPGETAILYDVAQAPADHPEIVNLFTTAAWPPP